MSNKKQSKINMYINKILTYPEYGRSAPALVLKADNGQEVYMIPIQCRSIQICGSPDGNYKLGSSADIGLAHIAEISHKEVQYDTCGYNPYSTHEEIARELIWSLASQAMFDFFSSKYGSKFNFARVYGDERFILDWSDAVLNYVDIKRLNGINLKYQKERNDGNRRIFDQLGREEEFNKSRSVKKSSEIPKLVTTENPFFKLWP